MHYLALATGITMLLFCGDVLVRGAVAMAVKLDIPTLVIGLTIVAFGTSAPELVVSLRAALAGSPGISIGNVVGSNIANILLVLGLPALIAATNCNQPFIRRNTLYVIGASLLFIGLCYMGPLSFWHGAILFGFMVVFLVESGRRAAQRSDEASIVGEETMELIEGSSGLPEKPWIVAAYMGAGLVGLPIGAHLTVIGATHIATNFGISEAAIGLTVVALGTSLPELATTTAAAIRGHCGLALGNVLGSNLFNILAIMGITAMVVPVPVPEVLMRMDLWVMLGAVLVICPFVWLKGNITRIPAVAFLIMYAAYIYTVFLPRGAAYATLIQH